MKKIWTVLAVFALSIVLLSGCGEMTLEEKRAEVQAANNITIQDVLDLMELEGLRVEMVTPCDVFQQQWPNAELVKVNEKHYLALQSFEENLNKREQLMRDIGWYESPHSVVGEDADVPNVATVIGEEHIGYKDGNWVAAKEYYGKNIVAILVYGNTEIYNLSTVEKQLEETEKIKEMSDGLARVFYDDINGMITEEIALESENFKVTGTLSYYQTGVIDNSTSTERTYYDTRTTFNGMVECSDAILEEYQGTEYETILKDPEEWTHANSTATLYGTIDLDDKELDIVYGNTEEILWKKAENAPVYELAVKIGDITETFQLKPDAKQ